MHSLKSMTFHTCKHRSLQYRGNAATCHSAEGRQALPQSICTPVEPCAPPRPGTHAPRWSRQHAQSLHPAGEVLGPQCSFCHPKSAAPGAACSHGVPLMSCCLWMCMQRPLMHWGLQKGRGSCLDAPTLQSTQQRTLSVSNRAPCDQDLVCQHIAYQFGSRLTFMQLVASCGKVDTQSHASQLASTPCITACAQEIIDLKTMLQDDLRTFDITLQHAV